MPYDFLERLSTPGVRAAQAANGAGGLWNRADNHRPSARFTEPEAAFIAGRESFYLASVSQSGWPYIQHRGGPPGFLTVLDSTTLGFADYRGNRQYISLGNVADDDRVALFLMDYPRRRRLKVLARMAPFDLAANPDLAARLVRPGYRAVPERGFTLRLEAFDWNCPQHVTPRFTAPEVEEAVAPLRARLALLEAENAELRRAADARKIVPSGEAPAIDEPPPGGGGSRGDGRRERQGRALGCRRLAFRAKNRQITPPFAVRWDQLSNLTHCSGGSLATA